MIRAEAKAGAVQRVAKKPHRGLRVSLGTTHEAESLDVADAAWRVVGQVFLVPGFGVRQEPLGPVQIAGANGQAPQLGDHATVRLAVLALDLLAQRRRLTVELLGIVVAAQIFEQRSKVVEVDGEAHGIAAGLAPVDLDGLPVVALRFLQPPLIVEQGSQVVEARGDVRMIARQHGAPDAQRTLEECLRLRVRPLPVPEGCQRMRAVRHLGMILAQPCLPVGQHRFQNPRRLVEPTRFRQQLTQVRARNIGVAMLGAEAFEANLETTPKKWLRGFEAAALQKEQAEVVQRVSDHGIVGW